jgi:predicted nuclease with TOPRIM domain
LREFIERLAVKTLHKQEFKKIKGNSMKLKKKYEELEKKGNQLRNHSRK